MSRIPQYLRNTQHIHVKVAAHIYIICFAVFFAVIMIGVLDRFDNDLISYLLIIWMIVSLVLIAVSNFSDIIEKVQYTKYLEK